MVTMRKRAGEVVSAGTYWNFETGKKVCLSQEGQLPGKPGQSYFKLPPLVILGSGALAAHMLIYVLPKFLVQFYEAYTEKLVQAYVIFDFAAIGLVLAGIAMACFGDFSRRTTRVFAFDWRPSKAYLAGRSQPAPVVVKKPSERREI